MKHFLTLHQYIDAPKTPDFIYAVALRQQGFDEKGQQSFLPQSDNY